MPRSEAPDRRPVDWRGWLLLAWALATGTLYARMILEQKAPALLELLARVAPGG